MTTKISYADAGVSIEAGNAFVDAIKPMVKATHTPQVLNGLGGFAAYYALDDIKSYTRPVLVSCTDGVGTKLKCALMLNEHEGVGQDLVAMCVNDLIVSGAKPLFFLDYYATGQLDPSIAQTVLKSIATGCQLANTALIGGETAEMPGMYSGDDYDLAGFSVGIVDQANIIDGQTITPGDVCLGLASSGFHSNGYSLVRKIIDSTHADLNQPCGDTTLGKALMAPTRIYVPAIQALLNTCTVKGMAHITGGGLIENIPRVLPADCTAELSATAWTRPAVYDWLASTDTVTPADMHLTFNCGIGMVIVVSKADAAQAMQCLADAGETVFEIGQIAARTADQPQVVIA